MKQKITMTIDEQIIKRIDLERGLIPRSAFIEELIKKRGNESKPNRKGGSGSFL